MIRASNIAGAIGLCSLFAASSALCDTPILATTFEKDAGDWTSINVVDGKPSPAGNIAIIHDADKVKEGKGTLQYKYNIQKGEVNFLMLPAGVGTLTKANSFHFWIQPDHSTSILFAVGVKGGARYQTTFAAKGKSWQEVSIAISDLTANEDPGTPKDPAGKLQADQIENLSIIDTDCSLVQAFGDAPPFINFASGTHTLLLSPFSVNSMELTPPTKSPAGERQLTYLIRPQIDWMVVGGVAVEKVQEKPLTGSSVRATYTQTKGKIFAMLKGLAPGTFTGAKQVKITVASKNAVTLMVQLEETDGGKYKSIVSIPAGSIAKEVTINIGDFTAADDSKDANDKLDLELVNKLLLIDLSGTGDIEEKENSLWFNGLKIGL